MHILKLVLVLATSVVAGRAMSAEFIMNFMPNPEGTAVTGIGAIVQCNRDGFGAGSAGGGAPCDANGYLGGETTPFLMEEVLVGGETYTRIVVGDPGAGFAQDVYIRGTSTGSVGNSGFAAGYSEALNLPGVTSSIGRGPLTGPGNASANPERVVMRQIIGGEWDALTNTWSCGAAVFCNEFTKATLLGKPRITQTVIDGGMVSFFDMDMSALGYTGQALVDMVSAPVVNNVTLQDVAGAEFAMTPEYTSDSVVSGGRFIYNTGPGTFGSEGTYTYAEGDFDAAAEDWTIYRDPDPAVNPEINL